MPFDSNPIQLLDPSLIHKLRSSLVISTLPQCIEELIRNALDANATSIDVIVDIERFSVQVSDNGTGIQNMSCIGQRYATSKCHSLKDLKHLKTFGFRGEALSSIISISMVHIISRHYLSFDTFEAFWRDNKMVGDVSMAKHMRKAHPGTTVIVRDLFYKYPVRRRQASTSYQYVVTIEAVKRLLMTYALCFPSISFTLTDGTRNSRLLTIRKSLTSLEIFRQLAGQEIAKYTELLDMYEDNIKFHGFFSTQGYPNKTHQYLYLNNYHVPNTSELYKVVSDMFSLSKFKSNLLESNSSAKQKNKGRGIARYPIFFIKLECQDWNPYEFGIHLDLLDEFPEFHRIKTLLQRFALKFLKRSGLATGDELKGTEKSKKRKELHDKDSESSATGSLVSSNSNNPYLKHSSSLVSAFKPNIKDIPEQTTADTMITWVDPESEKTYYIDPLTGNSYLTPFVSAKTSQVSEPSHNVDKTSLKRYNSERHYENSNQSVTNASTTGIMTPIDKNIFSTFSGVPSRLSKDELKVAKVLGQVDKKFIAIKLDHSKTILFMDQHAADERIKLEMMMKSEIVSRKTVILEPCIPIDLTSTTEYDLVTTDRVLEYLRLWGIHVVTTTKIPISFEKNDTVVLSSSQYFDSPSSQSIRYKYRVYVTRLPEVIADKCVTNHVLVQDIVRDYAYWIVEQQFNPAIINKTCPKGMIEILKSKACRSAIMFNDTLTLKQCQAIVQNLSKTSFPFQCAHGRPSVVPISIDTKLELATSHRKINWDKFKT